MEFTFFAAIAATVLFAVFLIIVLILFLRQRSLLIKKQHEYRKITTESISAIANAIDAKDPYTKGHSARVAAYSAEIARRLGYDGDFAENIYYIGLLHDVGKIGIPLSILNKPDKLTREEYEIIKTHPKIGHDILNGITSIKNLTKGAAEHHERWDGQGYYQGLSGGEISAEGRIICCADAYDAMTSDRAYRAALPKNVVMSEFKRCSGTQFDPELAGVMAEMISECIFETLDIETKIDILELAK